MEGISEPDKNDAQSENLISTSLVTEGGKNQPNYDNEVLVSQPSLSTKSTLMPDTLELR